LTLSGGRSKKEEEEKKRNDRNESHVLRDTWLGRH
jgi:hypothetical protein